MSQLQSPRGTRDILPDQQGLWQHVYKVGAQVADQFGFAPIKTPHYEYASLFQRSIGAGTDVIDKELFLLKHRQEEGEENQYALRPEGTAGIVRAFIEHGLHLKPQPYKVYSFVTNFRYDRPQKGRYREHTQFDLELFGDTSPFADAWIILAGWQFLTSVGLPAQELELQLNSLGTSAERSAYIEKLKEFLQEHQTELSPDSQVRLTSNPLRILDSKDQKDQQLLDNAPILTDAFGQTSKEHFEAVQSYLQTWDIPYNLNPRLVRGLDYYCHTAFEFTTKGAGGQQSALGGGGRYDGLITALGGPDVGGTGLGIGIDRVVEELERLNQYPVMDAPFRIAVISNPATRTEALKTLKQLIEHGYAVTFSEKEGFGSQLKQADRQGTTLAILIGEEELAQNTVTIKNLANAEQSTIQKSDLLAHLKQARQL